MSTPHSARLPRALALGALVLAAIALLGAAGSACGGGTKVTPEPDPEPGANEEVEPGVVQTPPPDATSVSVALTEFKLVPDETAVAGGPVYFLVANEGGEPHEFVVIKTDLEADQLPTQDGRVPEDEVDMIGEIEPFAAQSDASIVFDLEPGHYALICNIVDEEEGGTESHYEEGMRADLTVE